MSTPTALRLRKVIYDKLPVVMLLTICLMGMVRAESSGKPFQFVPGEAAIIVQYDAADGSGYNYKWDKGYEDRNRLLRNPDEHAVVVGARYLQEGVEKMTGKRAEILSDNDLSKGIILVLFKNAPDSLKNDQKVIEALKTTGKDDFNDHEAFYIRSDDKRVWLVANTGAGLCVAASELLEGVGYRVLGMGPNWTHIPDYKTSPLVFNVDKSGRPGFYLRRFVPHSGQLEGRSGGTLNWRTIFGSHEDESVEKSYERWEVSTRTFTASMPGWPGHAFDNFHKWVAQKMVEQNRTDGFLTNVILNLESEREKQPVAAADTLWINTNKEGPDVGKMYISNGKTWTLQPYNANSQTTGWTRAFLDLSVPFVRETFKEKMIERSNEWFREYPDRYFVFGTDPEDGGITDKGFADFTKNRNWYPAYRADIGKPLDGAYPVNGYLGLQQPKEEWTEPNPNPVLAGAAQTNSRFAFNNWLLQEYDLYVDSLPDVPDDYSNPNSPIVGKFTSEGRSKKEMVRTALYSYNYHDVVPEFQLDQRVRVMIAGFPKHRGIGKWERFKSDNEIAGGFKRLLPRQPSAVYWYLSYSTELDDDVSDIKGNPPVEYIANRVRNAYQNGVAGVHAETDFNFGTYGLAYYLYTKMLWNPSLSEQELEEEKNHWLKLSFGTGAGKMREYFHLMEPKNFVNAPNFWAKAMRLIDDADELIPDQSIEQKRLDDLKQFWYFYYLVDIGANFKDRMFREFMWKGQMSYMTAMHMVSRRHFGKRSAFDAAGPEFNSGPAHYTHEETSTWWKKIKEHWSYADVDVFPELDLGGGVKGKDVDLNDVIAVKEFQSQIPSGFINDATDNRQICFYTTASEPQKEIGFKLFWRYIPENRDYAEKEVPYGISYYDREAKDWKSVVDITMTTQRSVLVPWASSPEHGVQLVQVRFNAPWAGTYRIDVGPGGGEDAWLRSLGYDLETSQDFGGWTQTYFSAVRSAKSSPAFFYIPKGTKSLDLEIPDANTYKKLTFYRGLPYEEMTVSRVEEIPAGFKGTKQYPLREGENGSLVQFDGGRAVFSPYLYSVPTLWAQSPSALLVPRKIAEIDQLTPLDAK